MVDHFKTLKILNYQLKLSGPQLSHLDRPPIFAAYILILQHFCVEFFENQRDRGRRCTQNADKTIEQSFYACIVGRAGLPELCNAFCTDICAKTSRFSFEIANVSMKFDAVVAHHRHPAPSENAQKSQACVAKCSETHWYHQCALEVLQVFLVAVVVFLQ